MLTLRKMRWSNTFSYGADNEIDFTKSSVSQIIGKNGHGKSTIAHILEELLYNKNSKGYKKATILNRYVKSKSWSGSVDFEKDNELYQINVTRSGNTQKVTLIKNGEDISQHTATATYEMIEKLFGRDFKMFSQLIYQNSRSSLQFLTATDTVRKKFLIDLLNLEKYLEIHESLKEAIKEVTADLNKYTGELTATESWIKQNKNKNLTFIPLKDGIEIPDIFVQEYKEQSQLLNDIDKQNDAITKNNQYISLRNEIPVRSLASSYAKVDISSLIIEKAHLEQEIKREHALIDKITKLGNICPTCEQAIDENFKQSLITTEWESVTNAISKLDAVTKKIESAKLQNKKYEEIQQDILNFEKYSNLIDSSLPTVLHDKNQIEAEVNKLKGIIDKLLEESNAVIKWNTEAAANNSKLELLKEQLETSENELKNLKEKVDETQQIISHLEILKKAFSTNGLLAYKLEYSVKELESLTNQYLTELSDGRFQLVYVAVADKLNIIVKDNDTDVEIDALSSGELARVTTATLLAIRKLLSSLSKDSINILFLDETMDTLDEEGKERLIDVLLKETDLNTFIVSHMYSHPLLSKIVVTKQQGISKLEQL